MRWYSTRAPSGRHSGNPLLRSSPNGSGGKRASTRSWCPASVLVRSAPDVSNAIHRFAPGQRCRSRCRRERPRDRREHHHQSPAHADKLPARARPETRRPERTRAARLVHTDRSHFNYPEGPSLARGRAQGVGPTGAAPGLVREARSAARRDPDADRQPPGVAVAALRRRRLGLGRRRSGAVRGSAPAAQRPPPGPLPGGALPARRGAARRGHAARDRARRARGRAPAPRSHRALVLWRLRELGAGREGLVGRTAAAAARSAPRRRRAPRGCRSTCAQGLDRRPSSR
jgi:hypothetical protein